MNWTLTRYFISIIKLHETKAELAANDRSFSKLKQKIQAHQFSSVELKTCTISNALAIVEPRAQSVKVIKDEN